METDRDCRFATIFCYRKQKRYPKRRQERSPENSGSEHSDGRAQKQILNDIAQPDGLGYERDPGDLPCQGSIDCGGVKTGEKSTDVAELPSTSRLGTMLV
jgi:hypothetical protein